MARYIDADPLVEDLKNRMQNTFAGDWILKVIKDQPDIVRCKDCKHRCSDKCPMYHEELREYDDYGYKSVDEVATDNTIDDGFCDKGERIDLDD